MDKNNFQQTYPARPEELARMRAELRLVLQSWGVNKEDMDNIVLAVSEGCMNVIQHAYEGMDEGLYSISLEWEEGQIRIGIQDSAPAIDIHKIIPRNLDDIKPGGLGVHFIHEIMDEVKYQVLPHGKGNLLTMKKSLASD